MNGGDHEMTGDPSEEAAWQDLVAQYATPAATDGTPTPWPTREDLPGPGTPGQEEAVGPDSSGQDTADLDITGLDMAGQDDPGAAAHAPAGPGHQGRLGRPVRRACVPAHRRAAELAGGKLGGVRRRGCLCRRLCNSGRAHG